MKKTPPVTLTQRTEVEPVVVASNEPYPTFDTEAWNWIWSKNSFPKAHPPILYLGMNVPDEIANILGRSITLEEAQCLVQADGPITKCAVTKKEFQPVKYLPFVPYTLANQLAKKKLTEIHLPFGGQYYIKNDLATIIAASGSRFKHIKATKEERKAGKEDRYIPYYRGAMDKLAKALAKAMGVKKPEWPEPLEDVQRRISAREEDEVNDKAVNELVGEIAVKTPWRHKSKTHFAILENALDRACENGKVERCRNHPGRNKKQRGEKQEED